MTNYEDDLILIKGKFIFDFQNSVIYFRNRDWSNWYIPASKNERLEESWKNSENGPILNEISTSVTTNKVPKQNPPTAMHTTVPLKKSIFNVVIVNFDKLKLIIFRFLRMLLEIHPVLLIGSTFGVVETFSKNHCIIKKTLYFQTYFALNTRVGPLINLGANVSEIDVASYT